MEIRAFEQDAWDLLRRAAHDKRSPLRSLTLVTVSNGLPKARMLILRSVEAATPILELHTDIRSAKWQQLQQQPQCALLGWHPRKRLQIRLTGLASLHHEDTTSQAAWEGLGAATRLSYSAVMAPAHEVDSAQSGQKAYTA
ncbi:MAG: pyridoxamine 5'-phosphate oxidase family protein, partial [Bacteroidota bacterium]